MANNERISVLMDGETTEASWLKSVLQDSQQQKTWGRYHLIGDALRDELAGDITLDLADRDFEGLVNIHPGATPLCLHQARRHG